MNMPPLPGTSARFYNIMQSLQGHASGEFVDTCTNLRVLLNGDVAIDIDKKLGGKRNIRYIFELDKLTKSINIIHAASMIKELGPLYLFISEVLKEKDIFIVEEPESHLHPAAQRFFIMQIIVGLVEQGVYSLFTTHSDILIRTLAHSVYGSSLQKNIKRLSIDKLAIYLVKDGSKGTITKNVKISTKGTLDSLPSFDEVIEELYDEEMCLSISG
jgi:predicted ATPase